MEKYTHANLHGRDYGVEQVSGHTIGIYEETIVRGAKVLREVAYGDNEKEALIGLICTFENGEADSLVEKFKKHLREQGIDPDLIDDVTFDNPFQDWLYNDISVDEIKHLLSFNYDYVMINWNEVPEEEEE